MGIQILCGLIKPNWALHKIAYGHKNANRFTTLITVAGSKAASEISFLATEFLVCAEVFFLLSSNEGSGNKRKTFEYELFVEATSNLNTRERRWNYKFTSEKAVPPEVV